MGKKNSLLNEKPSLYGREEVEKDLSWRPMHFRNEEYLFNMPMRDRLDKVLAWAGTQIGSHLKGVIREFGEEGLARVARFLYETRKKEGEDMIRSGKFPKEQVNARGLGSLVLEWNACMGICGECVENSNERLHVRMYHCPVAEYLNKPICIAMGAEGMGLIEGLSEGKFTFKPGPCFISGDNPDPYCEWVVERI